MVCKFFDKKSKRSGITTNEFNYQLANELNKPVIKKFKKRKVLGCRFSWYAIIEYI